MARRSFKIIGFGSRSILGGVLPAVILEIKDLFGLLVSSGYRLYLYQ